MELDILEAFRLVRSLHNEIVLEECKYLIAFSRPKFFCIDKIFPKGFIFGCHVLCFVWIKTSPKKAS